MARDKHQYVQTRQTLLSRLKDWDNQDSWKEFFDTYWRLIYRTAICAGLSDAEAQDIVQTTLVRIAKKMPSFRYEAGKDSFKGWLLFQTRGSISTQLRRRHAELARADALAEAESNRTRSPTPILAELESIWEREWERNLLDVALDRVKERVSPKQFLIFSFYVLKEMPALEVARTLDVNIAKVYLAKHRISRLLQQEIERLRAQER